MLLLISLVNSYRTASVLALSHRRTTRILPRVVHSRRICQAEFHLVVNGVPIFFNALSILLMLVCTYPRVVCKLVCPNIDCAAKISGGESSAGLQSAVAKVCRKRWAPIETSLPAVSLLKKPVTPSVMANHYPCIL
jgi:hypothetical protein